MGQLCVGWWEFLAARGAGKAGFGLAQAGLKSCELVGLMGDVTFPGRGLGGGGYGGGRRRILCFDFLGELG